MRVRCECAPSLHRDPAHHYGATSGHHTHIIYLLEEWRKGGWRPGENGACTKHLASTKIWFVYVCICFNLYSICVSISYCVWMANLPVDSLDCSFSLHKLSLSLSQSLSRYTCFSFLFLFMFCKNLKPLFLSHKLSLSLSPTHFLSFLLPESLYLPLSVYPTHILPMSLISTTRKFLFSPIFSSVLSRHCFPINTEDSITSILKSVVSHPLNPLVWASVNRFTGVSSDPLSFILSPLPSHFHLFCVTLFYYNVCMSVCVCVCVCVCVRDS